MVRPVMDRGLLIAAVALVLAGVGGLWYALSGSGSSNSPTQKDRIRKDERDKRPDEDDRDVYDRPDEADDLLIGGYTSERSANDTAGHFSDKHTGQNDQHRHGQVG